MPQSVSMTHHAQDFTGLNVPAVDSKTPVESSPVNLQTTYDHLEWAKHEVEKGTPNLVAVHRAIDSCIAQVAELQKAAKNLGSKHERQALQKNIAILQASIDRLSDSLKKAPFQYLLHEQQKWIDAGFDERALVTDPEGVHFAVSTDLIYTILMFKDSADILEGEQITIPIVDGKALFKVGGEYLPYSAIKGRIVYSEEEQKFPGWNFIHPSGFVPRDSSEFSEMYPIAKLKPDAYERIARNASQFWCDNQQEVDPGCEKRYILQVITTGRSCIPRTWWGTNFDNHTPEHSSSRLITPDGYVYSFGTKMRPADAQRVKSLNNFLATALSTTSAIDYEESRSSEEKRVTSIPMTKNRFDAILRYGNDANKGFPFNFASQNCARFVSTQMALAGVPVNIKMSVPQCLAGILPDLDKVPLIGRPLSKVIAAVSFVVRPIIDALGALFRYFTPSPITKIWHVLTWSVRELFRRVGAVIYNGLFYSLMGAGRSFVPDGRFTERKCDPNDETSLPTSTRLLRWWDIFNPDAITVYHAYKLRLWQNKQKSSVFYTNPKSGFGCIDPAKGLPPKLCPAPAA
jgi:hypothetical protein